VAAILASTLRRLRYAGNDGAYGRELLRTKGRSAIWARSCPGERAGRKRFGAGDTAFQIFRTKVQCSRPIRLLARWLSTVSVPVSGLVETATRAMERRIFHAADGERERVFGILVENVVDDLDGVGDAFEHGANAVAGLPSDCADADGFRLATGAQLFHGGAGGVRR